MKINFAAILFFATFIAYNFLLQLYFGDKIENAALRMVIVFVVAIFLMIATSSFIVFVANKIGNTKKK